MLFDDYWKKCDSKLTSSYQKKLIKYFAAGAGEEDPSNSQDPLELEQTEDGEESVIMKDNHENLNKLLSTVEVSVTSEMKRRKKISQIVAEKNKKIPISVYDC